MSEPKYVELNMKEINEGLPVRYYSHYVPDDYEKKWHSFCSHLEEKGYVRLIQAINEGGYNSTWVCWDCLLEQMGAAE